jgi:hypothetical protein
VEIVAPESGAKLRGVANFEAEWPGSSGYVIFRVDGRFAYATTQPFRMRWDTSTAPDGSHVLRVDAYDKTGAYEGSSSVRVMVENTIPTPQEGVLLTVRFGEHDVLDRTITARGELAALRAEQVLPEGFDLLSGELRAELSQSVLDAHYEGVSALVRNRLRAATLTSQGVKRSAAELGQYAMVQVSRNGLAIPAAAGAARPRIGLGEISAALADYPVSPGDTWEAPLGVVTDLYTRRAVYVQGTHSFEGLRWFRGRECAVVTSTYTIPEVPLLERPAETRVAQAGGPAQPQVALTQAMGGGMRGGAMRGGGGMMGGGMRGGGAMRGAAMRGTGTAAPGGGRQGPAAAQPGPGARPAVTALESARLVDLEGERRTYVTLETGRVLYTEDTLRGKVEFRAAASTTAAARTTASLSSYEVGLSGMMGGGMRGGGAMRGGAGMAGGGMRGGATRGAGAMRGGMQAGQRAPGAAAPGRAPAAEPGRQVPPSLDYGLRLTSELTAS